MPPRVDSRYYFSTQYVDPATDRLVLTPPEPFRFQDFDDNERVVVKRGDTLWGLANKKYEGFPRPCGFWWVIMHFNGIYDPTLELERGSVIILPSIRTLHDSILAESRRDGLENY